LEARTVEGKLTAIFAADVEGYSRLMGIDEVCTLQTRHVSPRDMRTHPIGTGKNFPKCEGSHTFSTNF
jgi:hypothetical protein